MQSELEVDTPTSEEPDLAAHGDAAPVAEWYVAINDQQLGPLTASQVEEQWRAAGFVEETVVWKEGMEDWLPMVDVPQFAHLVVEASQQETKPAQATQQKDVNGESVTMAPVTFGGDSSGAATAVNWKPSAASDLSSLVDEELVAEEPKQPIAAEPTPPGGLPADLGFHFGASSTSPDPFQAASSDAWALPPMASPQRSGVKPIHWILGAVGVVGLLAAVAVVVVLYGIGPQNDRVSSPTPAARVTAMASPVTAAPAAPAPTPEPEPAVADPAAEQPAEAVRPNPRGRKSRRGGRGKNGRSAKASKPAKEKKDGMDDVFAKPSKKKLAVNDIHGGVKKNAGKVMVCLKTARANGEIVPGTYRLILSWDINPNGTVSDPRLTGPAKVMGTSLPGCFRRVMKKWKFPESQSETPVKNYPFGPFTIR